VYSNNQISEVRKSVPDLDKKVSNMYEKFSNEIEIVKKANMLEMKWVINQRRTQ
jgi:hypothetical protein